MIIVSIEEIRKIQQRIREINSIKLSDITFTEGGEPIAIDLERIDKFRFIGLNNVDFILSEYYKKF